MATKSNIAQPDFANWCRGEGFNQSHAIIVLGVPEDEEISAVEATLEEVKALGKVRVRGKMFDAKSQTLTLLCECREKIDSTNVPPEMISSKEGIKWTIVTAEQETSSDLFTEKLDKFLLNEGKTIDDIQRLYAPTPSWNSSPESIIRAVSDILQPKPNESSSYRLLRTFSGVHPTPPGEDNLDSWLEVHD